VFIVRALPPRVTYSDTRSMLSQGGWGWCCLGRETESEGDRMRTESEREHMVGGRIISINRWEPSGEHWRVTFLHIFILG